MRSVIAIDPGPEQSAVVIWDGTAIIEKLLLSNADVCWKLQHWRNAEPCVIEMIASYGMPVGAEVFETCVWIGRFVEVYGAEFCTRLPRLTVKQHLCHDSRAKDSNIRKALMDRFGGPASIRKAGPLYGVAGDQWAALALAVTYWDTHAERKATL